MKRSFAIIVILFLILCSAWAINQEFIERVWVFNGEQATTINLENTFYLPKYSTEWEKPPKPSLENGTYITRSDQGGTPNGIGHMGVAATTTEITFTVSTTGRFVSQSDPSKYRDFYVALMPRIRKTKDGIVDGASGASDSGAKDLNYYVDLAHAGYVHSSDERIPNSRDTADTGSNATMKYITVKTPAIPSLSDASGTWSLYLDDGKTVSKKINSGNPSYGYVYAERVYYDILLCLDPITSQDRIHMSKLDDYVAQIYIEWHCDEAECTNPGVHNGGYVLIVRGYYGGAGDASDNVFLLVTPEAAASRLDIIDIINNQGGREKIASMNVITTNAMKENSWDSLVKVFISSSNNYNVQGERFALKRYHGVNDNKPIYFNVAVYDEGSENTPGAYNKLYTGTDYWQSSAASSSMCLNLNSSIVQYRERTGSTSKGMVYNGVVMLELVDDGDLQSLDDIVNNRSDYSGLYKENIYFHILYNK